jgi:hypothetical protein
MCVDNLSIYESAVMLSIMESGVPESDAALLIRRHRGVIAARSLRDFTPEATARAIKEVDSEQWSAVEQTACRLALKTLTEIYHAITGQICDPAEAAVVAKAAVRMLIFERDSLRRTRDYYQDMPDENFNKENC